MSKRSVSRIKPASEMTCCMCGGGPVRSIYGHPAYMEKLTGHRYKNAYICSACYERSTHDKDETREETDIVADIFAEAWGDV